MSLVVITFRPHTRGVYPPLSIIRDFFIFGLLQFCAIFIPELASFALALPLPSVVRFFARRAKKRTTMRSKEYRYGISYLRNKSSSASRSSGESLRASRSASARSLRMLEAG